MSQWIRAAVAVPVAAFVLMLWAVHAPLGEHQPMPARLALPGVVLALTTPLLAGAVGVSGALVALALVAAGLVSAVVGRGRTAE